MTSRQTFLHGMLLLALSFSSSAKTDLQGCTPSTTAINGVASVVYYVPGSGEICSMLDCGSGGAPAGSALSGCPQYTSSMMVATSSHPTDSVSQPTGAPYGQPAGTQHQTPSAPFYTATNSVVPSSSPTSPLGWSSFLTLSSSATTTRLSTSVATSLSDTTITLMSASSTVTGLLFDTSAIASPVTPQLTFASSSTPSVSASVVAAATNAATAQGPYRNAGLAAILGAAVAAAAM